MTLIIQAMLAGLTNGFVYAIVGVGLGVIFRGSGIINAMQGEFAVVGAIGAALLISRLQGFYALTLLAAIVFAMVLGATIERSFVRSVERHKPGEEGYLLLTLGLAMLIGRFLMIVPMLALAGSLAAKKLVPPSSGTFPTTGPLWVGLLIGVILIVGGLVFFPALVLGPGVEHFQMLAGKQF